MRHLYLTSMGWWRHSVLSRTVALTILLWTAADLSNASLCALDNEDAVPFGSSVGLVLMLNDARTPQVPPSAPAHVDDCFCCSRCVEVTAVVVPDAPSVETQSQIPFVAYAPRIFGCPLYHPPQNPRH